MSITPTFEEIDDGIAGSNYGWPNTEGPTTDPAFRSPLFAYGHDIGSGIVGGAFYPNLTVQSNIAGTLLLLDGAAISTPFITAGPVGFKHRLQAPPTQIIAGVSYRFVRWSIGRRRAVTVTAAATDTTIIAELKPIS
jgi:alpha-beta hydrolase superfamily lysophospholipase